MGGEHLEGGEGEDRSEAVVEEAELGEQVSEKEVEGAKAHDGHDVGGVGEEGVAGDGEDGGDGVEGEDDVGELDGDEGEEEDGDHATAVFADEEWSWRRLTGWRRGATRSTRGVLSGFWAEGRMQADGGDEEDGGEEVADPFEASEEAEASGDEGSAHEDGAEDAPEEDFGLAGGLDAEEAEEEEEDEEVVDREGLFDGVAGEVLGCALAAHGVEEKESKGQGGGDPEAGCGDGGGLGFPRALAANVDELHPEEKKDEEVKTYPMADGSGAVHLCWMLQRSRAGCTDCEYGAGEDAGKLLGVRRFGAAQLAAE